MKKISVVVPVYFGEETLPILFDAFVKVEAVLLKKNISLQLIFVDDGSKDNTYNELLKIKATNKLETIIIKLSKNFGALCASNAGLKFVKGNAFTIFAADMQDPPELLIEMAENWLLGNKYIICQRNKERKDPFITRVFAFFYYKLLRLLVVDDFPDTGFDIMFLDAQFLHFFTNISKNINRALYVHSLGISPKILFYDRKERMHGTSKWTFGKKFKLFIDSFLGFSMLPIRLITGLGLIVSLFSFTYGIIVIIGAFYGNVSVPGYASLISMCSLLFGIIILMLGVIGEYIWRIFDELNKRPEFVIEDILD